MKAKFLLTALLAVSCSFLDDDSLSDVPGGSPDTAFTVPQAREHVGEKGVWVTGFVVGGDLSSKSMSFEAPFSSATSFAIASGPDIDTKDSCIAVQLPSGVVRDNLNLVSHPEVLGRRVCLKAYVTSAYFGITGLKNVSEYVLEE